MSVALTAAAILAALLALLMLAAGVFVIRFWFSRDEGSDAS